MTFRATSPCSLPPKNGIYASHSNSLSPQAGRGSNAVSICRYLCLWKQESALRSGTPGRRTVPVIMRDLAAVAAAWQRRAPDAA